MQELVQQANQYLVDSGKIIKQLRNDPNFASAANASTIYQTEITQLVLQFRIDTQSALAKLLQIEHGVLSILGINPHESSMTNIERMQYALGNDDLKNILRILNQLVHALLLMANRYQQNLKNLKQKPQKKMDHLETSLDLDQPMSLLQDEYKEKLETAIVKQSRFIFSLDELFSQLEEWDKLQASSDKLNYIAALRGPISEYFAQLFQNLEASYDIYGKLALHKNLEQRLSPVLTQLESLLKQLTPIYQPAHFFGEVKATPAHRLEERASAKRLSNFFNH